jgi:diguanylate cyclase (GGDEF)-like protein
MHDQLTRLPNRGLLLDRIEHGLASSTRRRTALAVLFVDLDGFKQINDTYGHAAGDTVLIEASRRMAGTLRQGDTLARLAGDEFVLLCEDLPRGPDQVLRRILSMIVSRLRAALARPMRFDAVELQVTASIGVAVSTDDATAEQLLEEADAAMYTAKRRGRGHVAFHDTTSNGSRDQGRRLAREIGLALDAGQLRLYYQPIFHREGGVPAAEALLRWQHPEHGLLDARQFIGLAQASGSLPRIGRWAIEQACEDLAGWRRDLGEHAPRVVFCNLSQRELVDPALAPVIAESLDLRGLEPCDLGLEVLEGTFADPVLVDALCELHQRGHALSVDDFGTAYSSLSRLIGLPAAYAKIDRSFISGLPDDERSRAFVDAVLVVARSLDLTVIAEGVETDEQRRHLVGAGCDLLQGFHLGRPMSGIDLRALLERGSPG